MQDVMLKFDESQYETFKRLLCTFIEWADTYQMPESGEHLRYAYECSISKIAEGHRMFGALVVLSESAYIHLRGSLSMVKNKIQRTDNYLGTIAEENYRAMESLLGSQ